MPNTGQNGQGANGEGNQPESKLDRDMVRWTRAVAAFTFLLFVTSAVSDWFIYQEWRNAGASEQRNVEQLRAVMRISGIMVSPGFDIQGNKTAGFTTSFQNFGSTRTARFRAWHSVQYFNGDVPNNFDPTKPNAKIDLADTIVGGNSPVSLAPAGIPFSQFEEALSHKGNLLIWGQAIYADIYSPNIDRHVSFCQIVHVERIQAKAATKTEPASPEQIAVQGTPYKNECNKSD